VKQAETTFDVKQRLPLTANVSFDVPEDWLSVGIQDIQEKSTGGRGYEKILQIFFSFKKLGFFFFF
jgi:hypothetical protein